MENKKQEAKQKIEKKENVEVKFVDVSVPVLGEMKQKKFVKLDKVGFSPERGNIFVHLDDKHTLLFKNGFLKKYLKYDIEQVSEIEKSVMKAPTFEGKEPSVSKVRMKVLGESEDGKRTFVGPMGSVEYDARYKGLKINLDSQHMTIIDGPTLSKELGIRIVPQSLEKNSLSR